MIRRWMQRIRARRYDDVYRRAQAARLERERRLAVELGALRVFAATDASHRTTGTLPQIRMGTG